MFWGDFMGILYAFGAAFFAGVTAFFTKTAVSKVDTKLATAIRTVIILIFSIGVVFFASDFNQLFTINKKTMIYLILSGVTTALLWLSYFKALQIGSIKQVTPIDKTSIVLTLILSAVLLDERITSFKVVSIILIMLGTFFMVQKDKDEEVDNRYIIYAILTAIFTSLVTILGKLGINNIDANIGTMIRTLITFIIIWIIVIIKKLYVDVKKITKKDWLYISLSGITTGLSWLCYFKALQESQASIVFPIEKLSIVVAIIFSTLFLREKLNLKALLGLILIVGGTLILLF